MPEVILFPDAALVLTAYLAAELTDRSDTAVVRTRVPDVRPDRLVRVERTGGIRTNLVTDSAIVTFECWAATEADAAELGQLVRALIFAVEGTTQIRCSRLQRDRGRRASTPTRPHHRTPTVHLHHPNRVAWNRRVKDNE